MALDEIPRKPSVSLVYLQHMRPMTPFILFPKGYGLTHRDVQIVTRSERVAQPLPVGRPFVGTTTREELQIEDDEILHQLCTMQPSPIHLEPFGLI